ncbi:hypothetical protein DOT66_25115 [Ralstonia pseudosolanacearum]|nr:hypothetical protein DOT66_25115 [Ralstonia pseudosolanacearum]
MLLVVVSNAMARLRAAAPEHLSREILTHWPESGETSTACGGRLGPGRMPKGAGGHRQRCARLRISVKVIGRFGERDQMRKGVLRGQEIVA